MQTGTPYVMKRDYLFDIENNNWFAQTSPPWGTLNAIDLSTGNNKWQVPLGFMADTTQYPDAKNGDLLVLVVPLLLPAISFSLQERAMDISGPFNQKRETCCGNLYCRQADKPHQ
jgi:hypothetical protein